MRDTISAVNADTIVALAQAFHETLAFQRALLDGVIRHVGADVGAFLIGETGPVTTQGLPASFVERRGGTWRRHVAELGPVLEMAARSGSAVDTDVLGERRVRSTRYFSEVVRPNGGRETLFAIPSWRGRPAACLLLGRCGPRGRFRRPDLQRVDALLPAIALASVSFKKADVLPRAELSARESEIVALLMRGFRSREIATALGTSVNTVRNQVSRLMARLGVGTRAELIAALDHGET
jgi:DNA-binding CsgD family transcriptional regulator